MFFKIFYIYLHKLTIMEIWKDIKGFEGLYQVSNEGRVKSLKRDSIMKQQKKRYGYYNIGLYNKGEYKWFRVHRLVAEAFIPNPNEYPIINHRDENPSNNVVENLEWCDVKYNVNYGTAIERKREKQLNHPNESKIVLQYTLDGELIGEFPSTAEVERKLGYDHSHIARCCNGGYFDKARNKWHNSNTYKGFMWKYKKEDTN